MQLPASTVLSSQRERLSIELDRMRRNHVLCDVVIVCETTEFFVHSNVLAASSSYFYSIFTAEKTENISMTSPENNNRYLGPSMKSTATALLAAKTLLEKKEENKQLPTVTTKSALQAMTSFSTSNSSNPATSVANSAASTITVSAASVTTTTSSTAATTKTISSTAATTNTTSSTATTTTTTSKTAAIAPSTTSTLTTTATTPTVTTTSIASNAKLLLTGLKKETESEMNNLKKASDDKKIDIASLLTKTTKKVPTQSETPAAPTGTSQVSQPSQVLKPAAAVQQLAKITQQIPVTQKTQISPPQKRISKPPVTQRALSPKSAHSILPPTSNLPETNTQAIRRMDLSEVSPTIMDHILTFIYTGHVTIAHGELQSVLAASHMFRLTELYNFCRETLVARLTLDNFEHSWDLSDLYSDPMLQSQVAQFAAKNFRKLQRSAQFMHLPVERLSAIVGSDRLSVASHDEVLDAVLSWVKHDRLMRQRVFTEVLPHIRFDLLSTDYMRSLQSEPIVMSSLELLQSLTKSMVNRSLAPGVGKSKGNSTLGNVNHHHNGGRSFGIVETIGLSSENDSPAADRIFGGGGQVTTFGSRDEPVMVVVGQDKDDSVIIQYLVLRTREWSSPVRATVQKKFTSVSTLKDEVYLIGGKVDLKPSATVHVYDLLTRRLRPLRSMHLPRCGMGVAELEGLIYVIGGYNKGGWIRDVECYDPLSNRWSFVSPLSEGREGVTVAGVHGKLVAVGGVPVPTTELYDPMTDQWTKVARMRHARVYHGVGVVGNTLFVVGGFGHQPDRVQCYDVIKDSWQVISTRAPAQCKDTWCAAVSWEGHVIVINSDGLVWDYDTVQETWTKLPASFSLIGGYISDFISATLVSL